jgi:hypothetical protein
VDNSGGWILVPDWDKFQHYKGRDAPWIKNYTALLSDPDYLELPPATQALLHKLWLLYAKSHRQVPHSTSYVSRLLAQRVVDSQLVSLNQAGFIQVSASKPLAPRVRSREELSKENSKEAASATTKNGRASASTEKNSQPLFCPRCGLAFRTDTRLAEHLDVVHWQ